MFFKYIILANGFIMKDKLNKINCHKKIKLSSFITYKIHFFQRSGYKV